MTADHGENLFEHGENFVKSHGDCYFNTSLEIPLIVWSHRQVFKGFKISGITSQAKIKALILDVISQASMFFSIEPNISALVNLMCKNEHFAFGGNTFILFDNSFKYVTNTPYNKGLEKLYRWQEDFFDKKNIYNDNEAIANIMQKRLSDILSERNIIRILRNKKNLTKEQIRNLKSLGYIK